MKRTEVIQKIIDTTKAKNYLEIGVNNGENFFPIKAKQKVAVDPNFKFLKRHKLLSILSNPHNILAKYYEVTSDDYFANIKISSPFEVAFIDGLHTYKQALEDVNNALNHLSDNGVIVMHDCNPPHEAAAYPAENYPQACSLHLPGWTGEWCGDVWKTVCFLRSQRSDLRVFVLDCDYGLGIVTKGEPESRLNYSQKDIDQMNYEDFVKNKSEILNLKDKEYLFEFLN